MTGQNDFLEAVRELERLARASKNHLSMKEIENYFSEMQLAEAQLEYICRYLESHDIMIEGHVRRGDVDELPEEPQEMKEDPLDEEMVQIYREETSRAAGLSRDQEEQLVYKLISGDENARNLLIEANLGLAMELAREYKGQGLHYSDLIQESNIGLMLAINSYDPGIDGPFDLYKEQMIRKQITEALDEYSHSTRSARKMASRVNELNRIATAFAREYEREAKPAELARRM